MAAPRPVENAYQMALRRELGRAVARGWLHPLLAELLVRDAAGMPS
jgi:hypothetical protein